MHLKGICAHPCHSQDHNINSLCYCPQIFLILEWRVKCFFSCLSLISIVRKNSFLVIPGSESVTFPIIKFLHWCHAIHWQSLMLSVAPGGPLPLPFAPGWSERNSFFIFIFIKSIRWTPCILQFQNTGLSSPSIFLRAQPWLLTISMFFR